MIECHPESEVFVKVLFQLWTVATFGSVSSISKDMAQYEASVERLKTNGEGTPEPGNPSEVEIPDTHEFAKLVEEDTVFLHRDEEGFITFPN